MIIHSVINGTITITKLIDVIYQIGKSKLVGEIELSGAKNSVLRLLAASILTDQNITIRNFPASLLDVKIQLEMLVYLGKNCTQINNDTLIITQESPLKTYLKWGGRSIRNSLLILGSLVSRYGEGAVPLPGGCQIGDRKFDLHEMILRKMGAEVWQEKQMLLSKAPVGGLIGTDIYLPIRSTGATENAIICATLAKGVTRIWNPHVRPEIYDLVKFLNKMGAKIEIFGQEHIRIQGVDELNGCNYFVMADNMEAITWVAGSVITNGDIEIIGFPFSDLEVALIHLKESGTRFYKSDNSLIVRGGTCYPIEISTGPHPGINSDVQPIFAAFGAHAKGTSKIVDLRFPGRYGYAKEMKKMGVDIEEKENLLIIHGNGKKMNGSKVQAVDLRAGAALLLCALNAEGSTFIEDAWQIERGYNNIVHKLKTLGAEINILNA